MRKLSIFIVGLVAGLGTLTACSDEEPQGDKKLEQWPLGQPATTLAETLLPMEPTDMVDPGLPRDHPSTYFDHDFGRIEPGDGESHRLDETLADAGATGTRRSLLYVLHLSDTHCLDEESPSRLTNATRFSESAWRPQENWTLQLVDMAVRTANGLIDGRPYDFAIVTGDLTDNAHKNEMDWLVTLLDGGRVDPDSGIDDDPVEGALNDAGDPFDAEGLDRDVPWYVVYGNHEQPLVGSFPLPEANWGIATGTTVFGLDDEFFAGTSRGDTEWPERIEGGEIPADPNRVFLRHPEFIERLLASESDPPGHGFTDADLAADKGYYSVLPVDGLPVRLIGLDTMANPAASEGWMTREQWDWFKAEVARAEDAGELVLIVQHHPPDTLLGNSPVDRDEYIETVNAMPNVIALLDGHTHANRIIPHPTEQGGWWEINAGSIIDFPQQFRLLELVDNGNGTLSLLSTLADHASPEDSPTALARSLSLAQIRLYNYDPADWRGHDGQRNAELVWKMPSGWSEAVANWPGHDRIESLTTLAGAE